MSWNSLRLNDIQSSINVTENNCTLNWTCPRCGHVQSVKLDLQTVLFNGYDITCQNVAVCGDYLSLHITFDVVITGYYKDTCDVPLNPPNTE